MLEKNQLLYKDLSYSIVGVAIEVRKNYGNGHKEILYHNALKEEFEIRNIKFEFEKQIKIFSPKPKKVIGVYKPDFVIEDKIILEIKALSEVPDKLQRQLYDYLKNSKYELGYFINFGSNKLDYKRIIYTNDRKNISVNQ